LFDRMRLRLRTDNQIKMLALGYPMNPSSDYLIDLTPCPPCLRGEQFCLCLCGE
jgi:hypothetical protein